MAEGSVEAGGTAQSPRDLGASGLVFRLARRPRVIVKADLMPASTVLSLSALSGFPLGWLWSRLAPPERMMVFSGGQLVPLQLESWHRFDDLAIYALLGLAFGIVTGIVVWSLRERRGPVIMIAAVLGGLLAAWLGMTLGVSFANSLYSVAAAPKIGDVIGQAPRLESASVLVAQPLAIALTYGLLAGWNGHDDLGRRLG